jgi:hypothetical protein
MEPAKEAPVRLLGSPWDTELRGRVVDLEAGEQRAERTLGSEMLRAHEDSRAVAGARKEPRQNLNPPRLAREVAHEPVLCERERGEDSQVRGQRDVRLRIAALEDRTLGREPVEVRSADRRAPVAPEVVGAQRVDRNQHDTRQRGILRRRAVGAAAEQCDEREPEAGAGCEGNRGEVAARAHGPDHRRCRTGVLKLPAPDRAQLRGHST